MIKTYKRFFVKKDITLSKEEERVYLTYKKSAEKRGYRFKLTKKHFRYLITAVCSYCGSGPRRYSTGEFRNGIDRIDNKRGYESYNVITCCGLCNKMKGSMDWLEFTEHCQKVYEKSKENEKTFSPDKIGTKEFKEYVHKHGSGFNMKGV